MKFFSSFLTNSPSILFNLSQIHTSIQELRFYYLLIPFSGVKSIPYHKKSLRKMNYSTALVVMIPPEFHDVINYWRNGHDKAYPRWMPHITLYYPFISVEDFPAVGERIQAAVAGFGSFEMNLNQINYFKQGKGGKSTIHLRVEDDKPLQNLFKRIKEAIPEIPCAHPQLTPHVTLGQGKDKDETNRMIREMEEYFREKGQGGEMMMKMMISEIQLINRSETDPSIPFAIHTVIHLN